MYRKHIVVGILVLGVLLILTTSRSSAQQPQPPEGNLLDSTAAQPLGMTFTYQGQLQAGGVPLDDTCSMAFRLYDEASSGNLIGSPVTTSVTIAGGIFTVDLNFGSSASLFNGDARWLDIRVKCTGDAAYTLLTPRQPLNPTPYALNVRPGARVRAQYGGGIGAGGSSYTRYFHVGSLPYSGTSVYEKLLVTVWGGSWYNTTLGQDTYSISSRGGLKITRTRLFGATSNHAMKVYDNGAGYDVVVAVVAESYPSLVIRSFRLDGNNSYAEQLVDSSYDPTGKTEVPVTVEPHLITDNDGNVGVGTTGPAARLQVTAGATQRAIHLAGGTTVISTSLTSKWNLPSSTGGNATLAVVSADSDTSTGLGFIVGSNVASPVVWMYNFSGRNAFTVAKKGYAGTGSDISTIDNYLTPLFQVRENGNVGIGTTDPSGALEIRKEDAGVYLNDATDSTVEVVLRANDENFEIVEVEDTTSTPQSSLGGNAWVTVRDSGSNFYVGIGITNPQQMLDVGGTARARVVQITGGSDLAEAFEVSGPDPITPGLVVAIDPQRPGALRVSDTPYDRTVAGCISGANGLNPGLVMQQEGSTASGDYPVAVSGRVYCWADASTGPIQPGDLLTTSALPGHLMRVSDYERAHGAVVGKAMSALEAGQGLVLVLVALQ